MRPTPVAMVTKIWKFSHKIHHYSACIWETSQIFAPTWGFWGRPIKLGHQNFC